MTSCKSLNSIDPDSDKNKISYNLDKSCIQKDKNMQITINIPEDIGK
jgi:hypothetical protein